MKYNMIRVAGTVSLALAFLALNMPFALAAGGLSVTHLSTAETYTEDSSQDLTDIVITDTDSGTVTATLTLSNTAAGSISTAVAGTVTSMYNPGTGVWTASGATEYVNTLLAGATFIPTANFNGNFTIATNVDDGINTALTGSKAVTGTPVNDAPVLNVSKSPIMTSVTASSSVPVGAVGTSVVSLADFATPAGGLDNVTDADSGAQLGIAIIDQSSSLICYESVDGGDTWSSFAGLDGESAILLAANPNNRIYCNSTTSGTYANALTIRAWDRTSGTDGSLNSIGSVGGSTAFSSASDTVSLTVIAGPDTTAPTVTGVSPASDATGVLLNAPLIVSFSEPMATSTVVVATGSCGGGECPSFDMASWSEDGTVGTFRSSVPLAASTTYTVGFSSGQDLAGNDLADESAWSFTTVAPYTIAQATPVPSTVHGNTAEYHYAVVTSNESTSEVIMSDCGNGSEISATALGDSDPTIVISRLKSGKTYACDLLIRTEAGDGLTIDSNTLHIGPFTVPSSSSHGGGGTYYGCKDPNATNYQEFAASKPELCTYATPTAVASATSGTVASGFMFTKTLRPQMTDPEVRELQKFLNSHGFPVAGTGPGSLGNETDYFGAKTQLALKTFQEAHAAAILAPIGLTSGTGIFGEATRAFINAL